MCRLDGRAALTTWVARGPGRTRPTMLAREGVHTVALVELEVDAGFATS